jgi:coatomer subunit beta
LSVLRGHNSLGRLFFGTQAMLIMTSIIRVGQSKFVTVNIDEDSLERIMNCIQTLSELEVKVEKAVHEIFLQDGRKAFGRMLSAQEKRAVEKKEAESTKEAVVQVDDLLTFRQFSKKTAGDAYDVSAIYIFFCRVSGRRLADGLDGD